MDPEHRNEVSRNVRGWCIPLPQAAGLVELCLSPHQGLSHVGCASHLPWFSIIKAGPGADKMVATILSLDPWPAQNQFPTAYIVVAFHWEAGAVTTPLSHLHNGCLVLFAVCSKGSPFGA